MSDLAGRLAKLAAGTDGVTYTDVAGIKEVSLSYEQKTIDVTDHDSGVWEEFIVGRKNVKMSCSGNYDEADAGQGVLFTSLNAGTIIYFRYRPTTVGGAYQYVAQGVITSIEDTSPNDEASEFSCEIQLTGTVTRSAQ